MKHSNTSKGLRAQPSDSPDVTDAADTADAAGAAVPDAGAAETLAMSETGAAETSVEDPATSEGAGTVASHAGLWGVRARLERAGRRIFQLRHVRAMSPIAAALACGLGVGVIYSKNLPVQQPNAGAALAASVNLASPGNASGSPSVIVTMPSDSDRLRAGDRLKLMFFENLDLPDAKIVARQASGGPALRTFFQRLDLSGEYALAADGSFVVPRLGRILAAGVPAEELRAALLARYRETMGRAGELALTVIERQPVYVVGPVKAPGAYKHVPGMIVLQAIALAGGLDRGADQASQIIEIMRERERTDASQEKLKRLIIQSARFEAERTGAPTVALPPQLLSMAGEKEAASLTALENSQMQQARRQRADETAQHIATVETARRELQALEMKIKQFDQQILVRQERLRNISRLGLRGSIDTVNTEITDIEQRKGETQLLITQSQQRLDQSGSALVKLEQDRQSALQKDIATNRDDLVETERTLVASRSVTRVMGSPVEMGDTGSKPGRALEIVRRTASGANTVIAADEISNLEPGDVLRVRAPEPPPVRPPAR